MTHMATVTDHIDNPWALAGTLGSVLITGFFAYLSLKAKSGADKKDQAAQPVIEKVEQAANLQPVVDELVRQMALVQAELTHYRPIAKMKYPIALGHISTFHQLYPDSGLRIPDQIKDDL